MMIFVAELSRSNWYREDAKYIIVRLTRSRIKSRFFARKEKGNKIKSARIVR